MGAPEVNGNGQPVIPLVSKAGSAALATLQESPARITTCVLPKAVYYNTNRYALFRMLILCSGRHYQRASVKTPMWQQPTNLDEILSEATHSLSDTNIGGLSRELSRHAEVCYGWIFSGQRSCINSDSEFYMNGNDPGRSEFGVNSVVLIR